VLTALTVGRVNTLTDSQGWLCGRIAGTALNGIRAHLGLTQERLAQLAGRTVATVQSWESGRRPMTQMRYTELLKLRRVLQLAGAPESLLACWDDALTADSIYEDIHTTVAEHHPFALTVPNRRLTELLLWPMTGVAPRALGKASAKLIVPTGVRDELAALLRNVIEQAGDAAPTGSMIRRQARHLLADHEPSREWVMDLARDEQRNVRDMSTWTPDWPAARSAAVAAATAGEFELLDRFVQEGLSTDEGMAANLNYWAYWVGECGLAWSSDADMTMPNDQWSGKQLLRSLVEGLDANVAYRELCAFSLWGLLRRKRELARDPATRERLLPTIEAVTSSASTVSENARRRLEQVAYLVSD
jgi:transcriptional regulator with XRE-family HTH domain